MNMQTAVKARKSVTDSITLEYNKDNPMAKMTLDYINLGVFQVRRKNAIDLALDDVRNGRVHRVANPKNILNIFPLLLSSKF